MPQVPIRLEDVAVALARTPTVVRALLGGVPEAWARASERPGAWSPAEVVAHLAYGERVDWPVRARTILEAGEASTFAPFDRAASIREADARSLEALLGAFEAARAENVAWLRGAGLEARDLDRTGTHPDFGRVTLRQLLATWVAHDHGHVVQIARTLARLTRDEVGPWAAYLSVMDGAA